MHVTVRHLRAAVGVAQHGSFRRAAQAVHLSQSAFSLTISELEGQLGVTLFDRTSRSVRLTELGAAFVSGAERVLMDFDQLVHEVGEIAQSRRGRVVVTCLSSIAGHVMPLAMSACAVNYPQLEVVVRDDVAQSVLLAVRSREADFGLTMQPLYDSGDTVFEPLHADRLYVVMPRDHRLARRKQVRWRELHGEPMIALSTTSGTHRLINDEFVRQNVVPASSTPVSHLSTVHGMLEAGFGISVLPALALPVKDHPTLLSRPLVAPAAARTIGVYKLRDRSLSPAAETFLEAVRMVLKQSRQ